MRSPARQPKRPEVPVSTNVFAVVGEHRDDTDRVLALGEDGRYYAVRLPDCSAVPVELTDEWVVQTAPEAETELSV